MYSKYVQRYIQTDETFMFLTVKQWQPRWHLVGEISTFLPYLHCLTVIVQLYNYYTIIFNFCLGVKFQSFLLQDIQNITKITRLTMFICQKSSFQQFKPHFILVGKLALISGYFRDTETKQKQRRLKTQKRQNLEWVFSRLK